MESSFSGAETDTNQPTIMNGTDEPSPTGSEDDNDGDGQVQSTETMSVEGYIRPESEPSVIPEPLVCDEYEQSVRYTRWVSEDEIKWGTVNDDENNPIFIIRVNELTFKRGETVEISLINVSDQDRRTGNPHKANFDLYTESGWQDVRVFTRSSELPITDEIWEWEPGESHVWRFEMTESGIVESGYDPHEGDIAVCPGLLNGRYRFATSAPDQNDVAVSFELKNN